MPVYITYYPVDRKLSPHFIGGETIDVLGTKVSNGDVLTVSGTANNGTVSNTAYLARIVTTEACRLELGSNTAVATANSEFWPANNVERRYMANNQRISVIS